MTDLLLIIIVSAFLIFIRNIIIKEYRRHKNNK